MSKKITVFGTRGIPDVLGGVETHCQNLYPAIKQQFDVDICVIARSPYVSYKRSSYKKVETYALWAPKKRSLEAIVHSVLAAFRTCVDRSDIVHVHAIGPGLVIPLLRVLGKKVVFTHHGPDYDRQKWGFVAKKILLLGERWAVRYANEVIVISEVINQLIQKKHARYDAHLIFNGVNKPRPLSDQTLHATLSRFGLEAKNYFVVVGRFVEEKGMHDAISAYKLSGLQQPLVLIGDADHPTEYSIRLKQLAADTSGVVMTGFLRGDELQAVFSQARLFVMPSYHEGLPIALLEAMSYSLPAVVSDIPANLEVQLPSEAYFRVGSLSSLAEKLTAWASANSVDYRVYLQNYDWQEIARKTVNVYHSIDKDIG
ncbi:TPA: glycosyltransferase family 4 protein [Citrobacter youngae]|uniref:glycosyltransferase family 4 protein n=1 Tax=Citrobacter TaxID=544 RepID=UPI0019000438|nr:glycosyltransferase family 4 protein [Citrobacter sp. FDAARGOS_156]HEE0141962.1 glycosyltransferase family 4 protein [Citrobacter youngae]MBJ9557944.1 glycosyltransferase family 4 protein [Citrobacter sp. FDAARGOS_156]HEF0072313.1 glycosyltransferase family 4 protein [Citrobacter youngae]HEF0086721.1 glycosyltransferase family 4 protein [Citrobacter youngae]HEF0095751.1 glycosyltransferase family 4 protein [Citrobacter youngae]